MHLPTLPSLRRLPPALAALASLCTALLALAGPVLTPWPVSGPDDTSAVAAAAVSGWHAAADTFEDSIELRGIRADVRRTITRAQIAALLPWMSLDGGADGPNALAFTATGRTLYILITDDSLPGDGLGSDAVLRYDLPSGTLSVFARLDAFDRGDIWPHLAMVHQRTRLYVGTDAGNIHIFNAAAASTSGSLAGIVALPSGAGAGGVRGLTVDRLTNSLFIAGDSGIWRSSLASSPALSFTQIVAGTTDLRALAWADTFGSASPQQRGLYLLRGSAPPTPSRVEWLTFAQAQGGALTTPALYTSSPEIWHDLAATADGRLLIAADEDAAIIADNTDARLSYDAWLADEWTQHVTFARGLISPDGEPAGWVIDGDTTPTQPRFHPATPDGAGWVLLALVMNHHLTGDPAAQADARSILTRYAGLAPDNIRPVRSTDGIYKHWIDPLTGNTEGTWPDEYATLSTMKIVMGAARAMQRWPDDPQIVRAASRIIFRTRNWDAYLSNGSALDGDESMAFKGLASGAAGADPFSFSRGFHEGIIFVEQAGVYGGAFARTQRDKWFNRAPWPVTSFIPGLPVTTANAGQYDPAFLSLYSLIVSQPYRADPAWRTHVQNLRWSHAAWTDDNGPRYYTVFSAGTNPSGYNADSIANHPADMTTFTSLLALCAGGDEAEAVAAYAAYRRGARQAFRTGASLLYRRSETQPTYTPNSAGLPDVTLGGLAIAEILQPGAIDTVLARPYPTTELCPVDVNSDGQIDTEDLYRTVAPPTPDLNGDNTGNLFDIYCLRAWMRRNEAVEMRP